MSQHSLKYFERKCLKTLQQRSTSTVVSRQKTKPTGNVDVEWTHDLHTLNNPSASRVSQLPYRNSRGGRGQARNGQRLLAALNGSSSFPSANSQVNIISKPKASAGMSIRGLAGPYIVLAKNFAPGTTAADIESAMVPVGGEIRSCNIVSNNPTTAELVFENKEGADSVIETFDQQTVSHFPPSLHLLKLTKLDCFQADGRLLSVFFKPASLSKPIQQSAFPVVDKLRSAHTSHPSPPTGPRADGNSDRGGRFAGDRYQPRERSRERRQSYEQDEVMDGSYGFEEKMDLDDGNDGGGRGQGLYSDELVSSRGNGRGRGDRGDGRGRDQVRRYR